MTGIPVSAIPVFVVEPETPCPVKTSIQRPGFASKDFTKILEGITLDCQLKELPQGDFVQQDFPGHDIEVLLRMVNEI